MKQLIPTELIILMALKHKALSDPYIRPTDSKAHDQSLRKDNLQWAYGS